MSDDDARADVDVDVDVVVDVDVDVDVDAQLTVPPDPQAITGGSPSPVCAFPSAVWLHGCSGTLVSPHHVVFASHCPDPPNVFFGEDATEGEGRTIPVDSCARYPGGAPGSGDDFAICRLGLAVADVPIVPPLMGCELDVLQSGAAVTIVGFGLTPDGDFARKHAVTTTLHGFNDAGEAMIGGDGEDACRGDSGGPVFVELPDGGGWRFFGITSYGEPDCVSGGFYSLVHVGMPWFEEEAAQDLTPCTDAHGSWDPDPRCAAVPMHPGEGGGDWGSGCDPGPVTGALATCGDPFAESLDAIAPQVAIVGPEDGSVYATQVITGEAEIEIDVDAVDEGWGVYWVELEADAKPLEGAVAFAAPFDFAVALPAGVHEITAVAYDYAGNATRSAPIAIGVDETPPSIPSPDVGGAAGCRTGDHVPPWPLAFLLAPLAGRRARRRAAATIRFSTRP